MSINHLIDQNNPYVDYGDLINIAVGTATCETINNKSITVGTQFTGQTLAFSDPSITGNPGRFFFATGAVDQLPGSTYVLKLNVSFASALASESWYVDITSSKLLIQGTNRLIWGQICSDAPNLPAMVGKKIEDPSIPNTMRLYLQTADGSNIVAGTTYSGSISFVV